jgi:hypothetical protein
VYKNQQGSAQLWVETREGPNEGFGRGQKQRMRFEELINRLDKGDDKLYLTTQTVRV